MNKRSKFVISTSLSMTLLLQSLAMPIAAQTITHEEVVGAITKDREQEGITTPSSIGIIANGVEQTTSAALDVTIENSTGNINLTELGAIDWLHLDNTPSYKDVPDHTIAYEKLGETQIAQMSDSPVSFTWIDGTPEVSQSNIKTGKVHKAQKGGLAQDTENGWRVTIGADARKRNLTFTCGGWQSQFDLSIYVDGHETPVYTEEFATTTTAINKKISVYLAPDHTYEVKAVMKKTTHSNGNATLSSIFVNEALADKIQLKTYVTSLKALKKANYKMESWIGFEEMLERAENVVADINSTQEQVDTVYTELKDTLIALIHVDGLDMQDKLDKLITNLEQVAITGYTKPTTDNLIREIGIGKEALITTNTNKEWDVAYAAITTALYELKSEEKYMDQTNPGLTSSFGWESDKHAPIGYSDGSYLLRDRASTIVRFGVTGTPGKVKWENHNGYLPCFDYTYSKDNMDYQIENFADKVEINGNDYVLCYSRMTVANNTGEVQLLPIVSPELVPLNEVAKEAMIIQPGEVLVRDYAIAGDRFGKSDVAWPTEEEVISQGSWDEHFNHMQTYWDDRLEKIATLEKLPDEKLINAYKAGFIYTMICKDGDALHVGENGYDRMYDHDTMGIVASLLTIGDFDYIKDYLDILPSDTQFEDSKWKFSWPFALYLSKTGDKAYIKENFERIKTNTRKITEDRVDGGKGIIKVTYSVDNWGQWTIDNWSALFGLLTYEYLSTEIGEIEEAKWAREEYADLLEVTNKTLEETLEKYNIDYIPCSIVEPNEISPRCVDPRDANWASMFLFGRWGWDGYLFNGHQEGANLDLIDKTYTYGFERAKPYDLGEYNFGGYPHGIYSSAYNAGYGSTALRGEEYRDLGIKAYQFMINNSMSGPFGWWEGVDYQDENSPWDIDHAQGGGGSCQHMWGQSVATKVLIDSIIAEKVDGEVIIGRGIPNEWIVQEEPIKINKYPLINNKRMGYELTTSGNNVTIQFNGDAPSGTISVELPILKNNIAAVSVGEINNEQGKVLVDAGTRSVTITLKDKMPEKLVLTQPVISAVEKQNNQIKVTWDKVENATGYEVECILNEAVIDKVKVEQEEAVFDTKKLYPDFTYEFRVKAYSGSTESQKSEAKSYKLELPQAITGGKIVGKENVLEAGSSVNLSQEGKRDWMRLGKQVGLAIERKSAVTPVIDIKLIGNKKITQMKDSIVKFGWNDGKNEPNGVETTYGAVFNPKEGDIDATGDLWMITAPADKTERILRIYTSTWAANTSFKAYLSDHSAPATTYTAESESGSKYKVFEFRYKASGDGETLCIRSSMDKKFNRNGNTALLAVTLSEVGGDTSGGTGGGTDSGTSGSTDSSSSKPAEPTKEQDKVITEEITAGNIALVDFKEKNKETVELKDITDNFAANSMRKLSAYGIMIGNAEGNFEPNREISRGEVAVVLNRLLTTEVETNNIFKDIKGNKYYSEAVLKLAALEIIKGYEDGTFKPAAAITREEFAVILGRVLAQVEGEEKLPAPNALTFTDSKAIGTWSAKEISILVQLGIVKGDAANNFNPDKKITRAEVSVLIDRLLIYLNVIE